MSEKNFADLVELPQEAVEEALLRARPYNLESEVMLSAIQWARRNPEASVAECCAYAIHTWME